MKIAYFDCFSGASGDMTLGALLDCGVDQTEFRNRLAALNLPGYELDIRKVVREGITATDVDVRLIAGDQGHGRHLSDIAELLGKSDIPAAIVTKSLAVFTRLADAEAKIHGTTRDQIHFHEVGAVDAIVDIVGSCILLEMLGVDQVAASSIPCGTGTIVCQHGIMPVPAPATMELLRGFPVHAADIVGELVTPTGAALITTLADPASAGKMPSMRVEKSGFGAGKKQFKADMPNLLRIVIGESEEQKDSTPHRVSVLETNLDDQNPETFDLFMERAFAAGALDVFFSPITMKKSRPGTLVTVLCPTDKTDLLLGLMFRETGTFGVRIREQRRETLARSWRTVTTPYGSIRIKVGVWVGEECAAAPEYEDCRLAAVKHSVPIRLVYEAAIRAEKI